MVDVDNTEQLTVLSLCSGYGGLELGLARALENPLRVVAVEIEAYALANLVAKAEEGKLAIEALWPDLRTFPAARFRGCFDFILAGYPCQPFSCAGRQTGSEHPQYLWPRIKRIIHVTRPEFVFLENVPNHLNIDFYRVIADLEALRFTVKVGLYSAFEAGVGIEHGKRLFVLGQTSGRGRFKRVHLSIRPRRQKQAQVDARWASKVLGKADGIGLQDERRESESPTRERGLRVAPQGISQHQWEAKRYVKSRVGGAVNGTFNRVDRLRLLGNGVVPQQAEKAFRELWSIINNQ